MLEWETVIAAFAYQRDAPDASRRIKRTVNVGN